MIEMWAVTYWIKSTVSHTEYVMASNMREAREFADSHVKGLFAHYTKIIRGATQEEINEINRIREEFKD